MDQHELHYRATLLFGTLDIPDGMRAMGLLSDEAYDHQVEGVILATRNDFGALAGAFRDLAKIARFKELNAQKDSLTGLFNLGFYNEMLAGQIKLIENMENPGKRTHARSTRGVAVLRIDMDRFKAINDTYGHRAGDEALKLAARIMIDALREDDVIARTGGDEFTILLKNIKKPDADALMKKLQSRFDVASFEFDDGRQKHIIDVNASVGITMIEAGQNAAEIFDNVDNDMMARKAGRKEKNPSLRYVR